MPALAPAHAEKRVALVVGNDRYANLPANEQLQKAVNDAHAVGGALRQIGFDVIAGENLDRRALVARLDELTQRLAPGDTAFFFFSGHGVALDGINYILPADVPDIAGGQETRLRREALDEPSIIAELTGRGVSIAVVVLDACRNNPFSRPGGKGIGVARGLAPPQQVQGIFSLYAAANGQTALDRLYDGDPNPNSVFSRVLVPALTKPGVDLATLAIEVREEVARVALTAGHTQQPAYYDQTIGGRVYLNGTPQGGGQAPKDGPATAPAEAAAQAWVAVQNSTSIVALDEFIRQYGNVPVYGALARERREGLAKMPPQVAMVVDTPMPPNGAAPLTAERERGLKSKDTFRECENCPEMVVVPAGKFTMGSPAAEKDRDKAEGPQHVVTIGRPLAVGKFHVTRDEFAVFARETGGGLAADSGCDWRSPPGFTQEGSHPVICVSWEDAKAYANWLTKKTKKPYRLLSEAEWEYAARGWTSPGAYPRFWFGNDEGEICRFGNSDTSACDDGYRYTSPVGNYAPNAFGLYDMGGNAWQWTADCYHDSYNGAPADGSAWTAGNCDNGRSVRGGAWNYLPRTLRVASRLKTTAGSYYVGFRVARTLVP
jgi:formylglycine-generating enzyme required for sulfatase activity